MAPARDPQRQRRALRHDRSPSALQLNIWWMRLRVTHQRTIPDNPRQNGAHERRHKSLKAEAIRQQRGLLGAQSRAFHAFRTLYNEERPHTALGGQLPASRYVRSSRPYSARLPPLECPWHFLVKRVTNAGTFCFKDRLLFIANALKQRRQWDLVDLLRPRPARPAGRGRPCHSRLRRFLTVSPIIPVAR
jgi:hypothetical protein